MTTQENRNQQQKTYKLMDIKHTLLNNYWNIEEIGKKCRKLLDTNENQNTKNPKPKGHNECSPKRDHLQL